MGLDGLILKGYKGVKAGRRQESGLGRHPDARRGEMMTGHRGRRPWTAVLALCIAVLGLTGCESTKHALGIGESTPPAPRYFDIPDVLIPPELTYDPDESVIYEQGGKKIGVMYLSGRVDVESLLDFFRKSMARDGWNFVSSWRARKNFLNFSRDERVCQMLIWETLTTTKVEIWVNLVTVQAR